MPNTKDKIEMLIQQRNHTDKESIAYDILNDIQNGTTGLVGEVELVAGKVELAAEDIFAKKPSVQKRFTWENCTKNQVVQPLQYITPNTYDDLVQIIKTANTNNCRVRAIGSGHSFSDVVQTNDLLINTDELNNPIGVDKSLLKDGIDTSCLVHVENGMKIRQLNKYLDGMGLALPNMGGYDIQSIVGASATATHGSGISLGPIPGFYRSIIMVVDDGLTYRIEPSNGITDPAKYKAKYPGNKLIQDDQWFNTVGVSMGSTGIIFSVILEVMPAYWLEEVRTMSDWESVKAMLIDRKVLYDNRHFEVLVNPYEVKGKHSCLITRRNTVPNPSEP